MSNKKQDLEDHSQQIVFFTYFFKTMDSIISLMIRLNQPTELTSAFSLVNVPWISFPNCCNPSPILPKKSLPVVDSTSVSRGKRAAKES